MNNDINRTNLLDTSLSLQTQVRTSLMLYSENALSQRHFLSLKTTKATFTVTVV
jgi:hypothetical protein